MGSSDYSRNVYSFGESASADPTLSHFSIEHDRAYIPRALDGVHVAVLCEHWTEAGCSSSFRQSSYRNYIAVQFRDDAGLVGHDSIEMDDTALQSDCGCLSTVIHI